MTSAVLSPKSLYHVNIKKRATQVFPELAPVNVRFFRQVHPHSVNDVAWLFGLKFNIFGDPKLP